MKRWLCLLVLVAACENPNEARDRKFFNQCPPGRACLAPMFAINRLKRDLIVKFDPHKKRFVQAKADDPDAVVLKTDGIIDFWRVPQYVMATPGASTPHDQPVPAHQQAQPAP